MQHKFKLDQRNYKQNLLVGISNLFGTINLLYYYIDGDIFEFTIKTQIQETSEILKIIDQYLK